jgi:hypothetical protein
MDLAQRLKGYILLRVEQHGEAWYVGADGLRHYLQNGNAAYSLIRSYGLNTTVSAADLQRYLSGKQNVDPALKAHVLSVNGSQNSVYYVCPKDLSLHSVSSPSAAWDTVKTCSTGITDSDLTSIPVGKSTFGGAWRFAPNLGAADQPTTNAEQQLQGRILLQTEQRGQAWFVGSNGQRHQLRSQMAAYLLIPWYADSVQVSEADRRLYLAGYKTPNESLKGNVLHTQKAPKVFYYVCPKDLTVLPLSSPFAAWNAVQRCGTGISDKDLANVSIGMRTFGGPWER